MSRHLGDQLSAYVDRRLPGSALLAWDRHVLVCTQCRYAVDQERGLLASLRSAPEPCVSESLQALLMGMGGTSANARFIAAAAATGAMPESTPSIPAAPYLVRGMRLPTVSPAGPPRHRSARRAALVAGLAAGASAAAAWTVGLAPVSASGSPIGPPAPVRVGAPNGLGAAYSGMLSFPVSQVGLTTGRSTVSTPSTTTSTTTSTTMQSTETPGR